MEGQEKHHSHLDPGTMEGHEKHHTHLDPHKKDDLVSRLRSVEGHVRGVERMVQEDEYCVDILKQTRAVQRALDKVDALLLENHLQNCASTVIRSGAPQERERVITELLEVFETTGNL